MAMTLAATDLGIGTCHAGVQDIALARRVLGLPDDRDFVLLISLGYPADRPLTPIRQPQAAPIRRGRAQRPLVALAADRHAATGSAAMPPGSSR